ncbi:FitA-like ribbon-helix-helix domain-containing protein [Georgenia yuyongxinii]
MATLTVRNLDPEVARALKVQAAANGRSMEAEARWILTSVTRRPQHTGGLGSRIRERFAGLGWDDIHRAGDAPRAADLRP